MELVTLPKWPPYGACELLRDVTGSVAGLIVVFIPLCLQVWNEDSVSTCSGHDLPIPGGNVSYYHCSCTCTYVLCVHYGIASTCRHKYMVAYM